MRIYTPQPLGGAVACKVSHLRIWFFRKCDLFPFILFASSQLTGQTHSA